MSFFAAHPNGFWLLAGYLCFPRLTLLLASTWGGGLLWWLAWLFCPYFLVAFIATTLYWNTDTFLCVVAWIIALNSLSDSDSDEKKKRERKKKMDEEVKYRKQSTWTPPVIDDEDDESWQGKPIEIPPR